MPLLELITALLLAQAPTPEQRLDLIVRARQSVRDLSSKVVNFTCSQRITRSQYAADKHHRNNCIEFDAKARPYVRDRVRLEVARVEGREVFGWPDGPRFEADNPGEMLGAGLSGSGDFGSFLEAVFLTNTLSFTYTGETTINGREAIEYSYKMPLDRSKYFVVTPAGQALMEYEGTFAIDRETAAVLRLTVNAPNPPLAANACRVSSTLEFTTIQAGDTQLLVPRFTRLSVFRPEGSWASNETTYETCHAFRAESTIRFDDLDSAGKASTEPPPVLPKGAIVEIALDRPIDAAKAWTGEAVTGHITYPVRDGKKVLLPSGTRVSGRLLRLQQYDTGTGAYAMLGLSFDNFDWHGTPVPLHLTPELPRDRRTPPPAIDDTLPAKRRMEVAIYTFPKTTHLSVSANFLTRWSVRAAP